MSSIPDAAPPPPSATPYPAVRLALPLPLHQQFDYALPAGAAPPLPGARVKVRFGRQQLVGICTDPAPADPHERLRPLTAVIDATPALDPEQLALGHWLSEYYHHPLGEVLSLLLPPAARRGASLAPATVTGYRLLGSPGDLTRAPKQAALAARLVAGPAPRATLLTEGHSAATIRALSQKGHLETIELDPGPAPTAVATQAPLTPRPEQAEAIEAICDSFGRFAPFLLEGITGSGKTEVYLQCMARVLMRGEQVLVLVPEIALTPQTRARFEARFGTAAALHSQVSDGERLDLWRGCRDGTVSVLIGTRSASLTPFARLGLIIVDEEHDGSYKQTEGLRYSARDLAVKRAADLRIPLVLGSATPALESIANARAGRYRHLILRERAGGAAEPQVRLLDIRGQSLEDGISMDLRRAIGAHLDAGAQVLVFLNRRGYAPSLICGACGHVATCAACDQPMTYHRQGQPSGDVRGQLRCHHCGARATTDGSCEACAAQALVPVGVGTQRSEEALKRWFPQVPCYRIDRDTARSKARLQAHFEAIASGAPALLIGTQILAKGHHFPNVTLVAMLGVDGGLAAADYRAPERTAQLIVQVAGRAGRAERPGEVWIQTLQPENPLLTGLLREGYPGFASRELERRREAGLPPAALMALLRADSPEATAPGAFLTRLRDGLRRAHAERGAGAAIELLGPVPAPMQRLGGRHRFQLLLLASERALLHRALRWVSRHGHDIRTPGHLRWSIDVDPLDCV
ncbi:MAG: primosomal protein N' [Pseudomonadota bacterium]